MIVIRQCKYCSKPIDHKKKKTIVFCSKSCSARYQHSSKEKVKCYCLVCEKLIDLTRNEKTGRLNYREMCDECLELNQLKILANRFGCNIENMLIENQTKGSLYERRKNWQSANSAIRKHARKVFDFSGLEKCCKICKYNKIVEICHIKSVSDFDDSAKIVDINSLDNLIALCPNHHWEFDNGVLDIAE